MSVVTSQQLETTLLLRTGVSLKQYIWTCVFLYLTIINTLFSDLSKHNKGLTSTASFITQNHKKFKFNFKS